MLCVNSHAKCDERGHMVYEDKCVNCYMKCHGTPLLSAICKNDLSDVHKLIAAGADVNLESKEGFNPLSVSLQSLMIQKRVDAKILEALLEAGANPNGACHMGDSPLIHAVQRSSMGLVKCVLRYGADVNGLSRDGETLLHYAAMRGTVEMVRYLRLAKAKPNIASWASGEMYGAYPLTSALFSKFYGIALELLAFDIDINIISDQGS